MLVDMQLTVPLNIYSKPWLMEPSAAMQLLECWEHIRAGSEEWKPEAQSARLEFFAMEGVTYAPTSTWDLKEFKGFDGATTAVIPIVGPLMKQDFCGSLGTASVISLIKMADASQSVQRIVFDFDTPGGTVDGTQALSRAIEATNKPTIGVVSGMCCSAGYWAISGCDEVYASSETDIIGSIGTMYSVRDSSKALAEKGIVDRTFYADASGDKNKAHSEAVKGNGKLLIEQHLNPMNEVFTGAVRTNRQGKVSEDALTGNTYVGQGAVTVGLVDGIKSMDEILNSPVGFDGEATRQSNSFNYNTKHTKMDLTQFKAEHPAVYAQAVAEGVAKEADRAGAYLTFVESDPKGAAEGIKSGKDMTQTQMVEFTQKSFFKQMQAGVTEDSAKTPATSAAAPVENVVPTPTAAPEAVAKAKQMEEWGAKMDNALGLK